MVRQCLAFAFGECGVQSQIGPVRFLGRNLPSFRRIANPFWGQQAWRRLAVIGGIHRLLVLAVWEGLKFLRRSYHGKVRTQVRLSLGTGNIYFCWQSVSY